MLGGNSFLLPITAFQILIKRAAGGSGGGNPISLSSTSTGSLIFLSSLLLTLSTDIGSIGITGDGGDSNSDGDSDGNSNGDGDGDGDGTGIVFCLFFTTFTFLFAFFLGGYKIAEVGID